MQKISEYGYLTMHEVQFIFGNKTWAYKVMKGLRSQGFIGDHDTLMSPRLAHYLTPKGYRILGKFGRLKVGFRFKPEGYSIFIFRHRMACAKVGLLLEKHPLVHDFLPESWLFKLRKSKADKLCDGEFWYRIPGHEKAERVGLEVELTLKSQQRLDESFRELARRRDLDQVWWICADDNLRRAMRREVLRGYLPPSQRHFFALLGEFLAAKGKAELMEPNGTLLSIAPDKPTLLPRIPEPPPPPPRPAPPVIAAPVARAEAPRPPEPAPPEPAEALSALAWRVLCWLGTSLVGLLRWTWEWIAESWSLYRRYDEGWELTFHRWPHVWAVGLSCLAVAGYRHRATLERTFFPPMPGERRVAAKRKPPKPAVVKHKPGDRCWWSHSPLEPDELVPCDTINDRPRPVDGLVEMGSNGRIDAWLKKMEKEQKHSGSAPKQSEPQ